MENFITIGDKVAINSKEIAEIAVDGVNVKITYKGNHIVHNIIVESTEKAQEFFKVFMNWVYEDKL